MSGGMQTQIFLVACAADSAKQHFEAGVANPVENEIYNDLIEREENGETRVWGVKEGNSASWQNIQSGDILLFYTGEYRYEYSARVEDTEHNPMLAERIWPDYPDQNDGRDESPAAHDYLIFIGQPVKVDIDSSELHDFAGYEQDHLRKFQPLNDQGIAAIQEEYGNVETYIQAHQQANASEMAQRVQRRFEREITNALQQFEGLEVTEEEVGEALDRGVKIEVQGHQVDEFATVQDIVGSSLHNAQRRKPITVHLSMRDLIEAVSIVSAVAYVVEVLHSGGVGLAALAVICRKKQDLTANQALTYGVGWKMVGEDPHRWVEKTEVIDEVVERSKEVPVVADMTPHAVDTILQQFDNMGCIDLEEVDDRVLVWFKEEFKIEYSHIDKLD